MLLCKVEQLGDYVRYLREHPEELRDPSPGSAHPRHRLLPRPRHLRGAPEESASLSSWRTGPWRSPGGSGSLDAPRARRPTPSPSRCWSSSAGCGGHLVCRCSRRISARPPSRGPRRHLPRVHRRECLPRAPAALLRQTDGGYRITKSVRSLCVFAQQNLVSDPPFSQVDLISCRNVLIYLGPVLQKKVLPILHYALRPEGFLVLGSSETVGSSADLFSLVDKRCRIYPRRTSHPVPGLQFTYRDSHPEKPLPSRRKPEPTPMTEELQTEADRLVLARYGPPGVIVNGDLEILHFRGHTSPYLEPSPAREPQPPQAGARRAGAGAARGPSPGEEERPPRPQGRAGLDRWRLAAQGQPRGAPAVLRHRRARAALPRALRGGPVLGSHAASGRAGLMPAVAAQARPSASSSGCARSCSRPRST